MDNTRGNYRLIGIDIGGSHITGAHISVGAKGIVIDDRMRRAVDSQGDEDTILNKWAEVLDYYIGGEAPTRVKVAIAMPGPFDYPRGISLIKGLCKYEALYGLNIRDALSSRTGLPPSHILFRNDAESFLHGEIVYNKVSLQTKTIGITLGTGLGAAVSVEGKTKDVFRAIEPMYDSIAEEYISTRWFQKRYKELTGNTLSNVKELLTREQAIQDQLFTEFGGNLGIFIRDFVKDEQANLVIIGGNIARCLDYFEDEVIKHLDQPNVEIRQSTLWEDAALIGAICSYPKAEKLLIKS